MSAISRLVTARLQSGSAGSQKLMALAIHEWLVANGEEEPKDPSAAIARIEETISRLKSGRGADHANAIKRLRESPRRMAAFAAALGIPANELQEALAKRTVFLDPALAAEVRTYFETRAAEPECRVHVEPTDAAGPVDLLRVAKDSPGCLIALADHHYAERQVFEAVDIAWSAVEKHPRGWVLAADRSLVEPPPPAAPSLFRNGTPCLPHEGYEQHLCARAYDRPTWIRETRERGEVPTFPVGEVFDFVSRTAGFRLDGPQVDLANVVAALGGKATTTVWWLHERRILAAGPEIERLRETVAPHHEIHDPESLSELIAEIGRVNPFTESDSCGWRALAARIQAATGLSLEPIVRQTRDVLTRTLEKPLATAKFFSGPCDARAMLRALLARELVLRDKDSFVVAALLDHVASSALFVGTADEGRVTEISAVTSSGHPVRIVLRSFATETPTPVVLTRRSSSLWGELDAGDVHGWISVEHYAVECLRRELRPADDD